MLLLAWGSLLSKGAGAVLGRGVASGLSSSSRVEPVVGGGLSSYFLDSICYRSRAKIRLCLGGSVGGCQACLFGLDKLWPRSAVTDLTSFGERVRLAGLGSGGSASPLSENCPEIGVEKPAFPAVPYVQYTHRYSSESTDYYPGNQDDVGLQMLGSFAIRNLLRCPTPYYKQFDGVYVGAKIYQVEGEKALGRPVVRYSSPGGSRHNAYRKRGLRAKAANRTITKLKALVEKFGLGRLMAACYDTTVPKSVSMALSLVSEDVRLAFEGGMRKGIIRLLASQIGCKPSELYIDIGTHRWGTKTMEPHFHNHSTLLNYLHVKDDEDEDAFRMIPWAEVGNTVMPMSPRDLEVFKGKYRKLVVNLVRKHLHGGVLPAESLAELVDDIERFDWDVTDADAPECGSGSGGKAKMNLKVKFIECGDYGWGQLQERLAYTFKHWCQDGVPFAKKHPELDDTPPAWLIEYENRPHLYGWARNVGKLAGISAGGGEESSEEVVSPLSGKVATFKGFMSVEQLLGIDGRLGALERVRGRFFHGLIDDDYRAWMLEAAELRHPGDESGLTFSRLTDPECDFLEDVPLDSLIDDSDECEAY